MTLHWADVPDGDAGDHVTEPARTVLDCARTLPFAEGLAVADSALRSGLVEHGDLRGRAARAQGRGARQDRRVAEAADPRAANPFESLLRAHALDAGLVLVPQVEIALPGMFARVDLADRAVGSSWRPTRSPSTATAPRSPATAAATTSWCWRASRCCGSPGSR